MANPRLTKSIKEDLTQKLLDHAYGKRVQELVNERAEFAQSLYKELFSEEKIEKMRKLPNGWLPRINAIKTVSSFGTHNWDFAGYHPFILRHAAEFMQISYIPVEFDMNHFRTTYEDHIGCRNKVVVKAGSKLDKTINSMVDKSNALRDEIKASQTQITTMLSQTSSMKKLAEMWPEVKPFLAEYLNNGSPAPVPAIPMEHLNASLGLPV